MRFIEHMLTVAAAETAAGAIVLAPFAVIAPAEQGSELKTRLDELHRRKIDLADEVIVVTDQSGYYGTSTADEIDYATRRGTPVRTRVVALDLFDPVTAAVNTLFHARHVLAPDALRSLASIWSCASAARYGAPHEQFWACDPDFYAEHSVAHREADELSPIAGGQ